MTALAKDQIQLLKQIPPIVGADQSQKDWAPVMSGAAWQFLEMLPEGLVEMHQKHLPILPMGRGGVMGVGFVRLTDAGRAALSSATSTAAEG